MKISKINECKIISIPTVNNKGETLNIIENDKLIPFNVKRIYYLTNTTNHTIRGGHAHKNTEQVILAISGRFEIWLDDGINSKKFILDKKNEGLYVPPMLWETLKNFSDDSICLVLASNNYDEKDYIREYDVFASLKQQKYK